MINEEELKEEVKDVKFVKKGAQPGDKVRVTGVGYENADGTGAQTTYKVNYEVTLVNEEKGAEYPYLVEYRGNRRYFRNISEK